jgi:DNA-binding response OmpR family regulator
VGGLIGEKQRKFLWEIRIDPFCGCFQGVVHSTLRGMPEVLVVDDEQHILDVVVYVLEEAGFTVASAMDGDTALAAVRRSPPDLVILDLTMPGLSGWDLFRAMRAAIPTLPVIMLTSRSDEIDRVLGLELGADDYVTKPFSSRELLARVRNILRRTGAATAPQASSAPAPGAAAYGALSLDPDSFCAVAHGCRIQLTRGEFLLMEGLVRYPARVFTRDNLIARLYDGEHPVSDRSVDAYIKRLRHKLRELDLPCMPICTIHGIGYKMNAALAEEGSADVG